MNLMINCFVVVITFLSIVTCFCGKRYNKNKDRKNYSVWGPKNLFFPVEKSTGGVCKVVPELLLLSSALNRMINM